MSASKRLMLGSGAAVAVALSLALGSVAASDDEGSAETMTSMEPMEQLEPGIHVIDAWARESPMLDLAGATYMVIRNSTDLDDALIGASSPAAEVVELHLSAMDDEGMMSMQQVPEIPIPAGGEAVLKPGSYHVMLIDLVEPLSEGTEVEISLEFMASAAQTIMAPVKAGGPMMMGDMDDDMDHDMDMDESGSDMDPEGHHDMEGEEEGS